MDVANYVDILNNQEAKARFMRLVEADYGNVEIGYAMGVCHETVRKWRILLDLPPRKRGKISPRFSGEIESIADSSFDINICLNCDKPKCRGYCERVH